MTFDKGINTEFRWKHDWVGPDVRAEGHRGKWGGCDANRFGGANGLGESRACVIGVGECKKRGISAHRLAALFRGGVPVVCVGELGYVLGQGV